MRSTNLGPDAGRFLVLQVTALFALMVAVPLTAQDGPPPTAKGTVVDTVHGMPIPDPYRWLEDQEATETREWIGVQNAYTETLLDHVPGREAIKEQITELTKIDVVGTPIARGGRYFFSKRLKDQDLFVIYMREGLDGEDQVLIDPHSMSEDNRTSVNMMGVSDDGTVLIYGIRLGGQDEVEVRFFDVDKREDLPDVLPRSRYFGVSLTPDNSGFYYTHFTFMGARIYYHEMGTDLKDDEKIFGEGYGPDKLLFGGLSDDGRHLGIVVMHGSAGQKTELYYKDLANGGPVETIVNDVDARFFPAIAGDYMLIQTNWNAPHGRVLRASLADPSIDNWEEIIPERDAVIQNLSPVGGKIFVSYLDNVIPHVEIFDVSGTSQGELSFETLGSAGAVGGRWDDTDGFFSYSSFAIPPTIYRYDVASGEKTVWSKVDLPIDSDDFEVKQVWYESKDGTQIPMFVVHKKGLELDGQNPTYLTGYGGFNVSRTPGFNGTAVFAVDQGMVYARPNLRGGGEFGEEWHRAGMLEKKQNVFDDFIAAAEWLIANDYTSPEKLAIGGGSNGGLLVGAAMTQRPELYRAVICAVPLLDMLRYHNFLVARFWISEYGSADDPEQFKFIYEYSPYHHVEPGTEYPAVLFIGGDADTRVAPLHARKMTALMQAATGSDHPILLKYDTKAGHSGGTPVSQQIEDQTDTFAFLIWQLGMEQGKKGVMDD